MGHAVAAHVPPRGRVCAGFSGGLDSTVLLDLLVPLARASAIELTALHVHHGLSPNADAWAEACTRFCAERGVPLTIERVKVTPSGDGLEAAARAARYAAFSAIDAECIALAHHREDQAETVLLQLLRGTGLKGASGMPAWRALPAGGPALFRPLIGIPRAALLAYAQEHGLAWVEDESNARADADRNFIRLEVAPRLDARFPGWRSALGRFALHAAQAQARLDDPAHDPHAALRSFLHEHGLRMPSQARLHEMARQLFGAREDAQVCLLHDGHEIRRFRGELHVEPRGDGADAWRVAWQGEQELGLGAARGRVTFESITGSGMARAAVEQGEWYFAPRAGGERLRPRAAGPSRTLKNLLQEHGVPPWRRTRMPLLFHGERLVWVPGIGIDADYACAEGAPGLRPCWKVAGNAPLC